MLDPLILELQKIKDEEGWSLRQMSGDTGFHYQTLYSWFHGSTLSNSSRKLIKQYLISRL